jgi:hypothetical protein
VYFLMPPTPTGFDITLTLTPKASYHTTRAQQSAPVTPTTSRVASTVPRTPTASAARQHTPSVPRHTTPSVPRHNTPSVPRQQTQSVPHQTTPSVSRHSTPSIPRMYTVSAPRTPTASAISRMPASPAPPVSQPAFYPSSPTITESSVSTDSDGGLFGEDPFTQQPYVPVHLRHRDRDSLPFHEQYSVTQDILAAYPPDLGGDGFAGRDWYVVWRGLEIGIFMDYW